MRPPRNSPSASPPSTTARSSCGGLDQQAVDGIHLLATTPAPVTGYFASYSFPFCGAPPSWGAGAAPSLLKTLDSFLGEPKEEQHNVAIVVKGREKEERRERLIGEK